jgi:AcrR family transcriptional regulator
VKRDSKRKSILQKSIQCFSRHGYDKTTLEDIGKACNLNKASLYYYYKNKEEIFHSVLQKEAIEYIDALEHQIFSIKNPQKRILDMLAFRLEYYQKVLNIHKLSIENLQQIEPKFKNEIERLEQVEQSIIELALKEFYPGKDVKSIAASIIMISNGIKHEYVRKADTLFAYEADYSGAAADTQLAIKLILKGLK